MGGFRLVEAKYPALLFKQQLDAFVQKIFPMMRDNVKKTITPMLVSGDPLQTMCWACLWRSVIHHQDACQQGVELIAPC